MKTYCKRFDIDEAFVMRAYERWRMNEAGRKNAWRVEREHGSAEALCAEIAREANDGTLRFAPIETRPRDEDGKVREIGVEPVKQQVCGYVVDAALEGLMHAKLGYWQVSREGMGQFRGGRAASRWLRSCKYHVHGDVRKCYDTLPCAAVMRMLRRYVRSPAVLDMAAAIMGSYPGGHLMIGSYFSMRMAHLVLSFGYHHVEGLGKRRRGGWRPLAAHQLWYVDDVWLFGGSKRDLQRAMRSLEAYMLAEFGLALKPWKVCRSGEQEPADVAGAVARPGRVTVRAKTFLRARRALMRLARKPGSGRLARRALSYWGWLKNTDCLRFCARNGARAAVRRAKGTVSAIDRKKALAWQ